MAVSGLRVESAETACPRLAEVIKRGIADGLHPGAQAFASVHGEPRIDHAWGEARPGVPMTTDSVVLWMSAGKPITAIAIAQLFDDGHAELDDPVAEYLPGFEQHGKDAITLRHVLTHTGGFRAAKVDYPEHTWEQTIEAVCAARLEPGWVPGQRAGYHVHTGWYVLGRVIEVASGLPFSAYVRNRLLNPLRMTDCWVGMPRETHAGLGDRLAVTIDTADGRQKPLGYETPEWCAGVRPGGNAYGPANQLGRFYEMLLDLSDAGRGGTGELDGTRVVSEAAAHLFTSRHREGVLDRTFRHIMDWGLGFMIDSKRHDANQPHGTTAPYGYGPHASDATSGHGGNQCAVGFADPAHGVAGTVLFTGQPGEPAHQSRLQAAMAAVYADLDLT